MKCNLLAVTGRVLAVERGSLAICCRRGSVLSRCTADRVVRAHLAVTHASGLVTS
jgi:hypothetical protein